jgi:hypothetical protein
MPMKNGLIVLSLLAASAGLASGSQLRPLDQSADPRRIVDRTLLCSTVPAVGYGFVNLGMTSPKSLPTGKQPAYVAVSTAGVEQSLAGLEAGPRGGRPVGGAHYNRRLCRVTTKRVPLTPRGLPGPPVLFDQYLKCEAGGRVLVRMRAVLDRRAAWRASQDLLIARGNFTAAAFAVRTGTGKPLAFFTLEAGKSRLWTAGSCDR